MKDYFEDKWLLFQIWCLKFCWYNEFNGHIRIHDYFSIMINQFPILVVRKYDNPHSENADMDAHTWLGIFGFTFKIK